MTGVCMCTTGPPAGGQCAACGLVGSPVPARPPARPWFPVLPGRNPPSLPPALSPPPPPTPGVERIARSSTPSPAEIEKIARAAALEVLYELGLVPRQGSE